MDAPVTAPDSTPVELLVLSLYNLMADLYALYFMAHAAHWNVEGRDFVSYHDFFGALYTDTFKSIDVVAEGIRVHRVYAPTQFARLVASSRVAPINFVGRSVDMVHELAAANEVVRETIRVAFQAANAAHDDGLANKLQDMLFLHDTYQWKLDVQLKGGFA